MLERIMLINRGEASDALATHRDDHLATVGGVPHVPTEVIMELAYANLMFEFVVWRHCAQYRHPTGTRRHRRAAVAKLIAAARSTRTRLPPPGGRGRLGGRALAANADFCSPWRIGGSSSQRLGAQTATQGKSGRRAGDSGVRSLGRSRVTTLGIPHLTAIAVSLTITRSPPHPDRAASVDATRLERERGS